MISERDLLEEQLKAILHNEDGATSIEYGLIAALIAVAVIGGLSSLGGDAQSVFSKVAEAMEEESDG